MRLPRDACHRQALAGQFAARNNIKGAALVIDNVCQAAARWDEMARACGVPTGMIDEVKSHLALDL